MRRYQVGVTLFEMIIVLVVVGIISSGFFMAFNTAILTHQSAKDMSTALYLAESRMEFLLGWRKSHTYAAMATEICSGGSQPAICSITPPTGFTVAEGTPDATDPTYTILTVSATGPNGIAVNLTSRVYNY